MTDPADTPAESSPPDIWTAVKRDYLSGLSGPVVAERHRVALRTLQRRAAEEGWRRADQPPPPPWSTGPLTREQAILEFPELEQVEAAETQDKLELLIDARPRHMRNYAFRRAAEAAALDQPRMASLWMRLVGQLDRCVSPLDGALPPFGPVDYMRAGYLASDSEPSEGGPE